MRKRLTRRLATVGLIGAVAAGIGLGTAASASATIFHEWYGSGIACQLASKERPGSFCVSDGDYGWWLATG
ncbi:hypothetical protein EES40_36265 [Streptomyces sp. ADI93-02]|nr:hypothetical protein EES40_36265 [Streptomyces sp. ADI93-02]